MEKNFDIANIFRQSPGHSFLRGSTSIRFFICTQWNLDSWFQSLVEFRIPRTVFRIRPEAKKSPEFLNQEPLHGTIKGSYKKSEKEKQINNLHLSLDFRRLGIKLWNSIFPEIR